MDSTYVNIVDIIAASLEDLIEQAEAHVLQSTTSRPPFRQIKIQWAHQEASIY